MRNILKILGLPLLAVLLLGSFPALGASRDTNFVANGDANVQVQQVRYHRYGYGYYRYHHHYRHGWYFGFYA